VSVNPQPISGTDPVLPVLLVAPQDGSPSQMGAGFEVEIKRDAGFQSTIEIGVDASYYPPNGSAVRRRPSLDTTLTSGSVPQSRRIASMGRPQNRLSGMGVVVAVFAYAAAATTAGPTRNPNLPRRD
jgi:hypothetical protein